MSVATFIQKWTPWAKVAGRQLGLPWQWILAQWGMETAWGSQPNMGENNPGNIRAPGSLLNPSPGFQNFNSPKEFITEYVNSMASDFPQYQNAKTGEPVNLTLFNGFQTYAPSVVDYGNRIAGALRVLEHYGIRVPKIAKIGNKPKGLIGNIEQSLGNAAHSVVKSVTTPFSGLAATVTSDLGRVAAFAGGLALVIIGLYMIRLGKEETHGS
jgi:hypothetical protein